MLDKFIKIIEQYNWRHCTVLLALSGGVDSMVMADLFRKAKQYYARSPYGLAGFDFAIAHCNFHLRGADSDADADLVREWAALHQVACQVTDFDTTAIMADQGTNVQVTARHIRYEWFEQVRKELGYDCIATAHHQQDSVETLLINFFKGTGIAGLHGILPEKKRIIRPLLSFKKEAIIQYAETEHIAWREDKSNQKDDYLRNNIRHHLLPAIEQVFPNAVTNLYANTQRFAEVEILYEQSIAGYRKKLLQQQGSEYRIPLRRLMHCKPLGTIVYELLKPFGLSPAQLPDVLHMMHSISGHYIPLGDYRLIKDRHFFILTPHKEAESGHILIKEDTRTLSGKTFTVEIRPVAAIPDAGHIGPDELFVAADKLTFPLVLRPWREGDYLYPFGMGMKKKKVKKLLIDAKIPLHEKEDIWVLEQQKKIMWVCGLRSDERFKVPDGNTALLHLKFTKNKAI
ncbi:tRNA lysidine(34) synthetase TilS [Taibaiella sp. KBW10]|uniref:tRNA lysidine(34) synthetase TilS n=1 Tax=Taibaiella sp. KBW10 TaxID=2153357 RepID=UPI000F594217|nr:tRNA lysidine(34) synthetase TilS [Taibaiella sp. KBW10]RQO30126.1 tRNA lysidine(34) synthetase TilS [Taibaiella sp. KBW10]